MKEEAQSLPAAPLAVSILDASRIVGMSRGQFYRVFLDTQRIKAIHSGKRDRVIDMSELRAAYDVWKAETRDAQE